MIFKPPAIAKAETVRAVGDALIGLGFRKSLFYVDDGTGTGSKKPINLDAHDLALVMMNVVLPPATPVNLSQGVQRDVRPR